MAKKWDDLQHEYFTAKEITEHKRWAQKRILELNLKAVRELVGKSQTEVANRAGFRQPEISKIESRQDHLLSTLRDYVEALGGELEVFAKFDKKLVKLSGV